MDQPNAREPRKPWWQLKGDEAAKAVFDSVSTINLNQGARAQDILLAMQYYGGVEYDGLLSGTYSRISSTTDQIALNVIRSCIDSAQAKIAKNNVKPSVVTNDGDWQLRRRSKDLDLFGQGAFYETKYHRKAPIVFRDAGTFGTGAMKIVGEPNLEEPKYSTIVAERTFINELKLDPADAIDGAPRNLYQEKIIPRASAEAAYPDFTKAIREADPLTDGDIFDNTGVAASEMVRIVEAWHLPSRRGATDGRRFLGVNGKHFDVSPWERQRFPFAFLRWSDPLRGFWGTGIVHELAAIQQEINFLLQRIQEAFRLLGAPCIFVERNSEFPIEQLTNVVGNVYMYTGKEPTVAAFQTIHPEVFMHLNTLYQRAYEIVGISQLSAQSKKPAGLDSGEAIRSYNEIETERFALVSRDYESHACDAFELMCDAAKDIDEATNGEWFLSVQGRRNGRRFMKSLKWSDVEMEEGWYQVQVFPTSSLPTEPAGRFAAVMERLDRGIIDTDEALVLLDMPDTEASNSLLLAARNDIEETFYQFFYGEDEDLAYTPPEPLQDLKLGLRIGQLRYLQAKREGVPEERLELARRWLAQAGKMLPPATPPAPPAPMMPGMPPAITAPAPQLAV